MWMFQGYIDIFHFCIIQGKSDLFKRYVASWILAAIVTKMSGSRIIPIHINVNFLWLYLLLVKQSIFVQFCTISMEINCCHTVRPRQYLQLWNSIGANKQHLGANKQHSGLIWVIYSRPLGSGLGTFLYPCPLVPSPFHRKHRKLDWLRLPLMEVCKQKVDTNAGKSAMMILVAI